ncbi:Pyruvate/2-oxoglutarate dehydrogenase complex, dihydrolipoamide acyltransferase (E2) component [Halanaeroarchaeum sp. HSR-CO]|uniref:dihydrolipoamide acetyltransferase family protein n=1 Tax=Halanaeroarchaeum sp. HSR-CO TaxID=2866382 RepID=UPI00217DDF5C|nr:dihydrolipoamide acetyltransferase family protein [Halanaeroarchaeum sp. HSR-CO]UWG47097.1 Pyruvate/2-oxoglutarate dehydrogenase complex, dihydrolipoamide acyltransferase (E2) component [Halanaeroarchaeum sp. HSR-CO]
MQKLTLPKSGQSMTEGTLVEWHVEAGEAITEGSPVLDFETEKMISEVTANQDGIVLDKRVEAGETVPVGTVLGYIGQEGETPPSDDADAAVPGEPAGATDEPTESEDIQPSKPAEQPVDGSEGITRATPSARRKAREAGVDVDTVGTTLNVNHVTPADIDRYLEDDRTSGAAQLEFPPDSEGEEILGTPWARVVADEKGVTIPQVGRALGKDRIRERDIHQYLQQAPESGESTLGPDEDLEPTVQEEIEITGGEKVMFDQMSRVANNYASTTTAARVDVTDLLDLYGELKESWVAQQGDSLSLTAFVARAVAQTLPKYPRLNAEYVEDANALRIYEDVHLGLAVNSDDGLIVPTIYDAGQQSVRELSRSIESVATKVQERKLDPHDLENGTFSISNAGSLGAYINTPQINPPQTAILGVCKIFDDAGVVDGQVEPRKRMHLCLTYDHRVVEGATAVEFLQTVKTRLENPPSLLS